MPNPIAASTTDLALIDEVQTAIAAAETVEEVVEIDARLSTLLTYAQKKLGSKSEEVRRIEEARLWAKRKLGQLTREIPKAKPPGKKSTSLVLISKRQSLADVGLTKNDASRAEAIASIPERVFKEEVVKPGASTAAMVRMSKKYAPPKAVVSSGRKPKRSPDSLWISAFARDVERKAKEYMKGSNERSALESLGDQAQVVADVLDVDAQRERNPWQEEFDPRVAVLEAFARRVNASKTVDGWREQYLQLAREASYMASTLGLIKKGGKRT